MPPADDGGVIGRRMPRTDGKKYVTGEAEYIADVDVPNQLHMALLRSEHAHAVIEDIDTDAAAEMDGVEAVLTGADLAEGTSPLGVHGELYGLAVERVRYYGEPVVAVAAEDSFTAQDAVERIAVEYTVRDAVVGAKEAIEDDAPQVHPELQEVDSVDGNVADSFEQRIGDVSAAFEEADHVYERSFRYPRISGAPMEPHGCIADFDATDDTLTFHTSTQVIHNHKGYLSTVFGMPSNRVQVVQPEVGGGFGNKLHLVQHEICAVALSKRSGRPVKAVLTRREQLEATKTSFNYEMDAKMGVTDDGTIVAWEEEVLQDEGAYTEYGLGVVGGAAGNTSMLLYDVPNLRLQGSVVYTNCTPGSAVRGTGVRQLAFARECLISEAADDLGIDPIEMRSRQVITNEDCPYETRVGNIVTSIGTSEVIETAVEAIDYRRRREEAATDPNVGIGVAIGTNISGCRPRGLDSDIGTVDVRFEADGSVTLWTEATDMGTSCRTTISQIAADVLGIEPESVRVVDGDTEKTPPGSGSHSSRTISIIGSGAARAADAVGDSLKRIAARELEASEADVVLEGGEARIQGTDRGVALDTLADIAYNRAGRLPEGMDAGDLSQSMTFDTRTPDLAAPTDLIDEDATGNISNDYPPGCAIAVVSVDPDTGRVHVESVVDVQDVGRAINPTVVEGQIHGGVVQGIGSALFEELEYDPETGELLNADFREYAVPLAADVPDIDARFVEVPSKTTPGGWKGMAEGPFIVAPAAIANAVSDAVGQRVEELPLTPARVKDLL
jgi:carbon-monoxide dehydrogenase large subunit